MSNSPPTSCNNTKTGVNRIRQFLIRSLSELALYNEAGEIRPNSVIATKGAIFWRRRKRPERWPNNRTSTDINKARTNGVSEIAHNTNQTANFPAISSRKRPSQHNSGNIVVNCNGGRKSRGVFGGTASVRRISSGQNYTTREEVSYCWHGCRRNNPLAKGALFALIRLRARWELMGARNFDVTPFVGRRGNGGKNWRPFDSGFYAPATSPIKRIFLASRSSDEFHLRFRCLRDIYPGERSRFLFVSSRSFARERKLLQLLLALVFKYTVKKDVPQGKHSP